MQLNIVLTGATGMVGEGVLLTCLAHPYVRQVLVLGRKPLGRQHPKLRELLVADFQQLEAVTDQLTGYDACFYCAGVSSTGLSEEAFRAVTYDPTLHVARTLARLNPKLVFAYISGYGTDSTGQGRTMWARVKGQTENAPQRLPLKAAYCLRPALIKPLPEQRHVKPMYQALGRLYPAVRLLLPGYAVTVQEIALAMLHSVQREEGAQQDRPGRTRGRRVRVQHRGCRRARSGVNVRTQAVAANTPNIFKTERWQQI